MLKGSVLTAEQIAAAAATVEQFVDPVSDTRGSAAWKSEMAVVWVRRALAALVS